MLQLCNKEAAYCIFVSFHTIDFSLYFQHSNRINNKKLIGKRYDLSHPVVVKLYHP